MVSDAEDDSRSYDVIYDETDLNGNGDGVGADEEEDEEDGVAAERVVAVSLSPCVSCAARLNLARCSFRKGEHAKVRLREEVVSLFLLLRRRRGGLGGGGAVTLRWLA